MTQMEDPFIFQDDEKLTRKVIKSFFNITSDSLPSFDFLNPNKIMNSFYTLKRIEIFDLIINKDDFYIESLYNLVRSKSFCILEANLKDLNSPVENAFTKEDLLIFHDSLGKIEKLKFDYLINSITDKELVDNLDKVLIECLENFKRLSYLKEDSTVHKNFWRQASIFKKGYFSKIINVITFLKSVGYTSDVKKEDVENLYNKIIEIFDVLVFENPILTALMFNPLIFSVLTKESNDINDRLNFIITERCYDSYLYYMKLLIRKDYKINVYSFLNYFFPLNIDLKKMSTKQISVLLNFLDDSLEITELKTYNDVNNHCAGIMNKLIYSNLINFSDDLLKKPFEIISNEKDQGNNDKLILSHKLFKKFFKILNKMNSENFIMLTQNNIFHNNNKNNNNNIELNHIMKLILKNTKTPIGIREILTITYLKYNHILCYNFNEQGYFSKVFKSEEEFKFVIDLFILFKDIVVIHYKSLKSNLEKFIRLFYHTIYYTYKTISHYLFLNSENLKVTQKCNKFYRITYLFLQCYKVFLNAFSGIYQEIGSQEFSFIYRYFNLEDKDIDSFLNINIHNLEKSLNELKNERFPYFDIVKVLKIAELFTSKFVLKDISINDNNLCTTNSEIGKNLLKLMECYNKAKENFFSKSDNYENSMYLLFLKNENSLIDFKNSVITNLLFHMIDDNDLKSFPKINKKNIIIIEAICKLFKSNTLSWQNYLIENKDICKYILDKLIRNHITLLIDLIIIIFKKVQIKKEYPLYNYYIHIIDFLRMLCEDNNKYFGSLIFQYTKEDKMEDNMKNKEHKIFIKAILQIWIKISKEIKSTLKSGEEIYKEYLEDKKNYFSKLQTSISGLLIELFQVADQKVINQVDFSKGKYAKFLETGLETLNLTYYNTDLAIEAKLFFKIINGFLYQANFNRNYIIRNINPRLLEELIVFFMKSSYVKFIKDLNVESIFEYDFPLDVYSQLINLYITNDSFLYDYNFQLAINMFFFLKVASEIESENFSNYRRVISEIESLLQEKDKLKVPNSKKSIRKMYKFLFMLVKTVEISYYREIDNETNSFRDYELFYEGKKSLPDKLEKVSSKFSENNNDNQFKKIKPAEDKIKSSEQKITFKKTIKELKSVIFLIHPLSLLLNESDINFLFKIHNNDGSNQNLDTVIKYLPHYVRLVNYRRYCLMSHEYIYYLSLLDYTYVEYISGGFAVLINMMRLFTLDNNSITSTIDDAIYYTSVFHLIFIFIFVSLHFGYSIHRKLYYEKAELNLSLSKQNIEKFSLIGKTIFTFKILPLLFNLIIGIIAISNAKLYFLFSLQLFIIFNFFDTMRNVIYSVKLRSGQYISTALLLVILILFFSSLAFSYFRDEYYSEDINENMCSSYLQCFLAIFNYGIRSSNIGFLSGLLSLDDSNFWPYVIFNSLFYFIMILIMINLINGIIVDTFQALREESNSIKYAKYNICYICSLQRSLFEINGLDFEEHIYKEHKTLNYFHYLIRLYLMDSNQFNSIESFVYNALKECRKDFFPIKKAISLSKKH